MVCPNCGKWMEEVSKYYIAPYGGYKCPECGLVIAKKTTSRIMWF